MSAETVRKWASSQPTAYLICRDTRFSHDWNEATTTAWREGRWVVEAINCDRCGAWKHTYISAATGLRGATKYLAYAEDYPRRGQGRLTKADQGLLRLESLSRRHDLDNLPWKDAR